MRETISIVSGATEAFDTAADGGYGRIPVNDCRKFALEFDVGAGATASVQIWAKFLASSSWQRCDADFNGDDMTANRYFATDDPWFYVRVVCTSLSGGELSVSIIKER